MWNEFQKKLKNKEQQFSLKALISDASGQPCKWIGNVKAAKCCPLKTSQFKKEIPKNTP